jgi:hypothetical protein
MHASPEIQIRLAEPQDAPDIAKVLYESFVEFQVLYTPEGFVATTPSADQILTRCAKARLGWHGATASIRDCSRHSERPLALHAGDGCSAERKRIRNRRSIA